VYQQIDHRVEVIVVNDGSTDSSLSILKEYKKQHDFMLIDQINKGLSAARNIGISISKGKYLLFVDSDDYLMPFTLEKLLVYLSKTDVDLFEYNYQIFNENSQKISIQNITPSVISGHGENVFAEWEKSGFYRPMVWTKVVSREMLVLNQLYFYSGIYHEDEEWSPKLFAYARIVSFLPLELYVYRLREGSIMSTKTQKHYFDLLKVVNILYDFSNSVNFSANYINAIRRNLSFLYLSVIKGIKLTGKYDEELVLMLNKNTLFLSFSDEKHRKYLYKWIINKFGIKIFYIYKYWLSDLLKKYK
jgi:glycosyltransferase involved in cell wall biosynthesis